MGIIYRRLTLLRTSIVLKIFATVSNKWTGLQSTLRLGRGSVKIREGTFEVKIVSWVDLVKWSLG